MPVIKIKENIWSVGILNPNMRVFDIVMKTEYGTSYNSYLVKGENKIALIEACHANYFKYFLENIKSVCNPEKIDYIVLNHNEPDHSGAVFELLKYAKNAKILISQSGAGFLKKITNKDDMNIEVVKDGDSIDLGGKTLSFISAPFLHWPDSIFTYLKEDKILFSCDFLGTHYCEPNMFDSEIKYKNAYKEAMQGYYNAIFSPFKPYVLSGLEKIKELEIDFAATSHGPILTKGNMLEFVKETYFTFSQPVACEAKIIPVFYCSAYGYTKKLAEKIKEGILKAIPDAKTETYNIIEHDKNYLTEIINKCDAFAIGSPTINRDAVPPVWELLSHIDAINSSKKQALVFGSFGWSGEAVPNIIARLNGLKIKTFSEFLKVSFNPSENDLEEAAAMGERFVKNL